jgi:hypothetical protein
LDLDSLGLGREAVLYMSYPAGVLPLPNYQGEQLGVLLFETLGPRIKRDLEVGWPTEMGRRPMASPEDYRDLRTSHLGTRWELGLPDSYLYAQQNH